MGRDHQGSVKTGAAALTSVGPDIVPSYVARAHPAGLDQSVGGVGYSSTRRRYPMRGSVMM